MICIGDVHGCYDTLIALLNKLPDDQICFVGDLIDRGPKSKEVVDLVINNNYHCVMGNHEKIMVSGDWTFLWFHVNIGGKETYKNYDDDSQKLESHIEWMKNLQLYLTFDDLIVSHSSASDYILSGKKDSDLILWNRYLYPKKIHGYYNIFGHDPHLKYCIKDHFARIDTGCVFKNYLTALQYPNMKIFKQKCIDEIGVSK